MQIPTIESGVLQQCYYCVSAITWQKTIFYNSWYQLNVSVFNFGLINNRDSVVFFKLASD